MHKRLPTYSQNQINQLFALVLYSGYDQLNDEDKNMLSAIMNDMYILDKEENSLFFECHPQRIVLRNGGKNKPNECTI